RSIRKVPIYAIGPPQGKRALRRRASAFQAHDRENRAPDRVARPRVLREAYRRAQAQEGGRGEAPLQASAQPDAAQEEVLTGRYSPRSAGAERSQAQAPHRRASVVCRDRKSVV